jgi:hypothetical protein
MSQAQGISAQPGNVKRDSILITCPPVPNVQNGLAMQPSFRVCGGWDTSGATYNVTCELRVSGGTRANQVIPASTVTVNADKTWNATFNNVAAGTTGTLRATLYVNNVATQSADVNNVSVVANGGVTCTC